MFELDLDGEKLIVISVPIDGDAPFAELSKTELEVASDAIAGLSNREIATKRGRAVRTIANQLASIYRKVGVGSRAELAARFRGSP